MLKGAGLLLFALFIDGLQAMISLALFGVISGVSIIPVVGTIVGAVAGPIGLALGMAISVCLSITMGGGLIAALAFNGMFYPSKIIPAFFELVPGLNNGPVWTFVVLRCMWQHAREHKSTRQGVGVLKLATAALPAAQRVIGMNTATTRMRGVPQTQQVPQSGKDLVRAALTQRPAFDGIRPLPPRPIQSNVKTA